MEAAAINKLYGIRPDDPDRYMPPEKRREDIVRSRGIAKRDSHFSKKNNWELVCFCRGVGCRKRVLRKLEGRDLWTREQMISAEKNLRRKRDSLSKEQRIELAALQDALTTYSSFQEYDYFVFHRKDKGGKYRFAPIIGDHKAEIVSRFRDSAPREKVWKAIPSAMDVHNYRAEYATALYKEHAREISQIPYDKVNKGSGRHYQSDAYHCRGDMRGVVYDRAAMRIVSKALGHNRESVIASNYLRGI